MRGGIREIKRFYFIIHPFYHRIQPRTADREVTDAEAKEVATEWYKTIHEAYRDKESVLIVHPNIDIYSEGSHKVAKMLGFEAEMPKIMGLVQFAHNAIGNRLLVTSSDKYVDAQGRRFTAPKAALLQNGFIFYPNRIKTKGMGEYTLQCVFQETTMLNSELGMQNPVPWKNRQSMILPKRSISEKLGVVERLISGKVKRYVDAYYPTPGETRELKRALEERKKLKDRIRQEDKELIEGMRSRMQKYRDTKFEAMGAAKKMLKEGKYRRK